jgi:phosphoenolpyruvate carboxykinase (GTP)
MGGAVSSSARLDDWVAEVAAMTRPDRIVWCDGSDAEHAALVQEMERDRVLIPLNAARNPGCHLHRSHPSDVARTEHLTFICSTRRDDAGPLNNWMAPAEAKAKLGSLFAGAMRGRTMYVVPYLLGPAGSKACKVGVELTDSPYVVASMRIMTRIGTVALEALGSSNDFTPGLHSLGDLDPERRFICHFPEERLVWSIGSGYGGNALLAKKCFALRIASILARDEGWLAEHMLIVGIESPRGETTYVAAAFPSACGKTNLAMLRPPASQPGWKVWTVGDDIAWLWIDAEGGLRAVNPEAGFFGVVPGTSADTNPNMMEASRTNTIFTNVALAPDGSPWWEGLGAPPARLDDWQGKPWTPASGRPAAHPNSRMTTPARQCPSISPRWEDPAGVPISAIIFGGRRARVLPLVLETFDWKHGVTLGASMASETTAAAAGDVGKLRRDPMAMRPFCGYHAGDYFAHWLEVGKRLRKPPRIFHVNWFRKDGSGKLLWPGYGENLRVLRWIIERSQGRGEAVETAVGYVPGPAGLDLSGLALAPGAMRELLQVSPADWEAELHDLKGFFDTLGPRMPEAILREREAAERRVRGAGTSDRR